MSRRRRASTRRPVVSDASNPPRPRGILAAVTNIERSEWLAVVLSFLLAIGLSWSHVWRRLTGQYSTDDID